MRLSVKLSLLALAAYLAAAVCGEVQYRVARARDVTPAYNVVDTSARYMPPLSTSASSGFHLMGTDNLGRSVGLRLAQAARIVWQHEQAVAPGQGGDPAEVAVHARAIHQRGAQQGQRRAARRAGLAQQRLGRSQARGQVAFGRIG